MEARKLVQEIMIPAEYGAAYYVKKGQIQRVIMIDGPQVGDWTAFNANNFKEHYDSSHTFVMNSAKGTGASMASGTSTPGLPISTLCSPPSRTQSGYIGP